MKHTLLLLVLATTACLTPVEEPCEEVVSCSNEATGQQVLRCAPCDGDPVEDPPLVPGVIKNGSFDEFNNPPRGWKAMDVSYPGSCFWGIDLTKSTVHYDGDYSILFQGDTACMVETDTMNYPAQVQQGTTVNIGFSYKRVPGNYADQGTLKAYGFWLRESGAPLDTFHDAEGIPSRFTVYTAGTVANEWVNVTRTFQVPSGAHYLRLLIGKPQAYIPSSIYLDRVSVVQE